MFRFNGLPCAVRDLALAFDVPRFYALLMAFDLNLLSFGEDAEFELNRFAGGEVAS